MNNHKKNKKSSRKRTTSPDKKKTDTQFKETEKVKILLVQLKIANEKWLYMEERRLKTLELFLSYSGLSTVGLLLFTDFEKDVVNVAKFVLPMLFVVIGWIFFILFWYREYYFQLSKSWCRRIEQELQLIYKDEQYQRIKDFDGAFRLYYYGTNFGDTENKYNDWSSYMHGGAIAFTTMVGFLVALIRFNPDLLFSFWTLLSIIITVLLIFWVSRKFILCHLINMVNDHPNQRPPEISEEKTIIAKEKRRKVNFH